jgi:intron-binding protein aquarius
MDCTNLRCTINTILFLLSIGYGDPGSAHYRRMPNMLKSIDLRDTFIDEKHLLASFPNAVSNHTYDIIIR